MIDRRTAPVLAGVPRHKATNSPCRFRRPIIEEEAMLAEDELKRFEGTWRYESTVVEGLVLPDGHLKEARLVLRGDRFEMTDPMATYRGTFTVDPASTPKTIEVRFTEGPESGKTSKGIYELEGDTYMVCIGLAGRERPQRFASEPGSGHALQVLRRVDH
jgi:uncharacterized protein (TIGR03067 family)